MTSAVRPRPSMPGERCVLTPEEGRRFLAAVPEDRYVGFFVLAPTLGLRRGEILGLRWAGLDDVAGVIRIVRALQRVGGSLTPVEPKTRGSRRLLPLPRLAAAALDRERVGQAADRLEAGSAWVQGDFVFTTVMGTPVEPRNLSRRFDGLRREAGLPDLRLMTSGMPVRHSCSPVESIRAR